MFLHRREFLHAKQGSSMVKVEHLFNLTLKRQHTIESYDDDDDDNDDELFGHTKCRTISATKKLFP